MSRFLEAFSMDKATANYKYMHCAQREDLCYTALRYKVVI